MKTDKLSGMQNEFPLKNAFTENIQKSCFRNQYLVFKLGFKKYIINLTSIIIIIVVMIQRIYDCLLKLKKVLKKIMIKSIENFKNPTSFY